jgi:hypothetical protein
MPVDTGTVAESLSYPTQTTRRALEDLTAHGIVRREPGGQGKADRWGLSDFTLSLYGSARTVPEKSEGSDCLFINPKTMQDDISGKVGDAA